MIRRILFGTLAVLAGSAVVASAAPKEEVTDAAKKVADAQNYSWKQTTQNANAGGGGGGGRRGGFGGGNLEGKTEKDGFTHISQQMGDNTLEVVVKGDKGAIKTQDGWQSFAEASEDNGQQNFARFFVMRFQNFKGPAKMAEDLADKAKDLKKDGDVYSGDLTEDAIKSLMPFGRRGGGQGPDVSNAKGTVKFTVKDGTLSKIEYHTQYTISFNGNDRDVDNTTTIEIKDVGSTKVDVPEEAKKKVG